MQVVILAGGKGTRMGNLTQQVPKPMLPLAGKPILEHQIELARRYGHTDIVLLTGHLGNVIEEYFGDGARWGVRLRYCREPSPLGTAGAVKEVEAWLDGDFLVFYGDVMMDVDLQRLAAFHAAKTALATLVVHPNGHPYDSDLLEIDLDGRIVAFHPKPRPADEYHRNLVNAALYVVSPKLLHHVVRGRNADLAGNVFPELVRSGQPLFGYTSPEYIMDIGTIERMGQVDRDIVSGKVPRLNLKNARPAVFLDRDGVLNVEVDHVRSAEALQLLPGAVEAVRRINRSDCLAVVVSNQPAVAKGFLTEGELDRIHARLETLLGAEHAYLDRIYSCPHHPDRGFPGERPEYKGPCGCRKPEPGMILAAARELNVDLARSFVVGDRTADIQAGWRAGCKTVLVRTGHGGRDGKYDCRPDFVFDDLVAAVRFLLPGQP